MLRIRNLCVQYPFKSFGKQAFWKSLLSRWWQNTASESPNPRVSPFVLQDLTMEIQSEDFLVILGQSGTGKTTLLRSIAGLTKPNSGEILIKGTCQQGLPPHQRDVAYVTQSGGWYDHLTVREHFEINDSASIRNKSAAYWLDRIGLTGLANYKPTQLSGGQLQRLAIGRAVARRKSLMLLDEPLNQLDAFSRRDLIQLLRQIHAEGQSIVYVTHDHQDAFLLATRIAVLHQGSIRQIDVPRKIYDQPQHISVANAIGFPSMEFFKPELFASIGLPASSVDAVLGVRPRDWRLSVRSHTGQAAPIKLEHNQLCVSGEWSGESWGDGQVVGRAETGHAPISVLLQASEMETSLVIGTPVWLSVDLTKVHCFDRFSGNRIELNRK